jgi:hypothetical protein
MLPSSAMRRSGYFTTAPVEVHHLPRGLCPTQLHAVCRLENGRPPTLPNQANKTERKANLSFEPPKNFHILLGDLYFLFTERFLDLGGELFPLEVGYMIVTDRGNVIEKQNSFVRYQFLLSAQKDINYIDEDGYQTTVAFEEYEFMAEEMDTILDTFRTIHKNSFKIFGDEKDLEKRFNKAYEEYDQMMDVINKAKEENPDKEIPEELLPIKLEDQGEKVIRLMEQLQHTK